MSNSLRDQLMGLGFTPAPKPPTPVKPSPRAAHAKAHTKTGAAAPGKPARDGKPRHERIVKPQGDIDLAKAFAIRAQQEKDERIEAERIKQEQARLRREARAKLEALLKDKALNAADADHVRHFDYGGKIKRIHVTAGQLKALNAGELGVVQLNGRYLLVDLEVMGQAEAIFPPAVALKVDPKAPMAEDPYSDPKFQVPDDLVW